MSFYIPGTQQPSIAQLMVTLFADTVFAEAKAKDYTREEWEAALDKAKQRAEPDEDECSYSR